MQLVAQQNGGGADRDTPTQKPGFGSTQHGDGAGDHQPDSNWGEPGLKGGVHTGSPVTVPDPRDGVAQ